MINEVRRFVTVLILINLICLFFHIGALYTLNQPFFEAQLLDAYLVNFLLAIILYFFMTKFRYKLESSLGFVFMGGSGLKFAAFFIWFYPNYKADDIITKIEFSAFFIPYAANLVFETAYLLKTLNSSENQSKK